MSEQRFLRSRRYRAMLWYGADGCCQSCGEALPEHWHADHRIPWRLRQRTNVHEMEALCPSCNRRKGGSMPIQDRAFQTDLRQVIAGIVEHRVLIDTLYVDITTGGGKSSIPPAFMPLIYAGLAQKLCWVVPRVTLGNQAEEAFLDPGVRQLFPHKARLRKTHGNDINPTRGHQGYETTYHAIGTNPELHWREFEAHSYILILDECHHVEEGSKWHKALNPLMERAAFKVLMSGTWGRGDKKRVAYAPYEVDGHGHLQLRFPEEGLIRYTRANALREGATVRLDFDGCEGMASWIDQQGERQERTSFEEEMAEDGAMLEVALRTDFARQVLQRAIAQWQQHKRYWPPAKLLIVAPWQRIAEQYARWCKEDFGLEIPVATCDRALEAEAAIKRYKKLGVGCHDALITVAMAYEGLDVKEITHLVCLTRYRTAPWLEQCFGRACRAVPGKHAGYIYAPDDMAMRAAVEIIKAEQVLVDTDEEEVKEPRSPGKGTDPVPPGLPAIVPLASQMTAHRAFNYAETMDRETTAYFEHLMAQRGLSGVLSALELQELLTNVENTPKEHRRLHMDLPPTLAVLPSQVEQQLRRDIQNHASWADFNHFDGEHGATNRWLKSRFPKQRDAMDERELIAVQQYLHVHFPRQTASA